MTPPEVARWLAEQLALTATSTVLDPSAGSGRLLWAALDALVAAGAEPTRAARQLIGVERDPALLRVAREALRARVIELGGASPRALKLHEGDALTRKLPRADAVILNPPYANADALPAALHETLGRRWPAFYRRQIDLSALFLALGVEALRPGGRLCAITPRYWLEATNTGPFRAWLLERLELCAVLDLGDIQVWPRVQVLTALLVARRKPKPAPGEAQGGQALWWRAGEAPPAWGQPYERWEGGYTIPQARLSAAPWNQRAPALEATLAALEAACPTRLDAWFTLGQGCKAGCNEVFLMTEAQAQARGLSRWLLPVAKAREVGAGALALSSQRLLHVVERTPWAEDEATARWLQAHRARLEARFQVQDGAASWYALSIPQGLGCAQTSKLLVPLYARALRVGVDRVGHACLTDVYWMIPKAGLALSLEAAAMLLGSAPWRAWAKARAKLKRDGYLELGRRVLGDLPLPVWPDGRLCAPDAARWRAAHPRAESDDPAQALEGLAQRWSLDPTRWQPEADALAQAWLAALAPVSP
jgi:SAM-dependent methyltransferase